jgi:hypothetical protein
MRGGEGLWEVVSKPLYMREKGVALYEKLTSDPETNVTI